MNDTVLQNALRLRRAYREAAEAIAALITSHCIAAIVSSVDEAAACGGFGASTQTPFERASLTRCISS